MGLDIHHYARKYERTVAQVHASAVSQRNKDLILGYRDACLLQQTCGKVRLIRALGLLLQQARILDKDFDTATREDIQRLVTSMLHHEPPYSAETIGTYKAVLKRFYTWLVNPHEFGPRATTPPIVSWIATTVRARDKHRLERLELLLPDDLQAALAVAHNPRDRALLNMLWESGSRIAELGNLQLKHVHRATHGFTLDLTGKTGRRAILLIASAPALAQWLNNHPFRHDPTAPLWVHYQYADKPRAIGYQTIRKLLIHHFRRAGIAKRIYPHLFRHSRATYVLASGIMTEAQAKAFFGWTPGTDMLSTYAHLLASDANNAILRENNLAPVTTPERSAAPRACPACNTLNNPDAAFCSKCTSMLDERRALLAGERDTAREDLLRELCTLIVERGLADDVARLVQRTGLGRGLATLADAEARSTGDAEPSTLRVGNLACNDAVVQRSNPLKHG
jgi:integrase/recombinase XerD